MPAVSNRRAPGRHEAPSNLARCSSSVPMHGLSLDPQQLHPVLRDDRADS